MRRIMLLLMITAIMTAMLAASAGTASAKVKLGEQFGGHGATNIKLDGFHFVLTPSDNFNFNF